MYVHVVLCWWFVGVVCVYACGVVRGCCVMVVVVCVCLFSLFSLFSLNYLLFLSLSVSLSLFSFFLVLLHLFSLLSSFFSSLSLSLSLFFLVAMVCG